jgi:tRNA(Ile)-lysidine synthase
MVQQGDRVVLAASGGPDSTCLLDILHRLAPDLDLHLVVAHFDHRLRGVEDASETRFVREMAQRRGLAFETGAAPDLLQGKGSLEERAREARYSFLEGVRQKYRGQRLAVAHTMDDQAETVLMRLLRGSGPSGLAGIPLVREPGVIRPLINVRRFQVEDYLRENGLSWCTDPSNLEPGCLRNRIRLEVLPQLLEYQNRLVEHLADLADLLREEDRFMGKAARQWLDGHRCGPSNEKSVSFIREAWMGLEPGLQRRIIRQAVQKAAGGLRRLHRVHVDAVAELIRDGRSQAGLDLPGGLRVRREYERILFGPPDSTDPPAYCASLPGPGTYDVEDPGLRFTLEERAREKVPSLSVSSKVAFLDADVVSYPLELRPVKPGDRFVPLGMRGHRKVKDFLIDRKVPLEDRCRIPVLASGGRVVWLCGHRIDDQFKVTDRTGRILEICMESRD